MLEYSVRHVSCTKEQSSYGPLVDAVSTWDARHGSRSSRVPGYFLKRFIAQIAFVVRDYDEAIHFFACQDFCRLARIRLSTHARTSPSNHPTARTPILML